MKWDLHWLELTGAVVAGLILASLLGRLLASRVTEVKAREILGNLRARAEAWWMMAFLFLLAVVAGRIGASILFGFITFLALREFITLTPTQRADHRVLFWVFFVVTPLQYYFIAAEWYALFFVFIPVYAYILVPVRNVIAGETREFLARMAKIQWAMMVCIYFVSHAPALLTLTIPGYEHENAKLLFFLVFIAQINDTLQYVFGRLFGRTPIAPTISPERTVEGFLGGVALATVAGASLWWITPFSPVQAAVMALAISLMGAAGSLVMAAIKRDRGVKDYASSVPGHGGIMDRLESICFAAPVFFHLTRYYFMS